MDAKRLFDFCLALLGLLISLPVWGLVALAIWLEDGRPIFYIQRRVGQGGTIFQALKFRSMRKDASLRPVSTAGKDQRITWVGSLMRATAMDELPQLWNILKGDMSFVGPRTEPVEFIEQYAKMIAGFVERRYRIRPGLTGIAQVYGRHDSPPRHKLRYDELYIQKRTFWLDLKLIVMSFLVTFLGRWEHREHKFQR